MKTSSLISWLIASLVVATLAFWGVARAPTEVPVQNLGAQPALPELEIARDSLGDITLKGAHGAVHLHRQRPGGPWLLRSLFDYPADQEKVARLLAQLAAVTLKEKKTARPSLHATLGLADPGADSTAFQITLADIDGFNIGDLVISKAAQVDDDRFSFYLRFAQDGPQVWRAVGRVRASDDSYAWVDRRLLSIPRPQVRSIVVTPAQGAGYELTRAQADEPWKITALIEQGSQPRPAQITQIAEALTDLTFTALRPRQGLWRDNEVDLFSLRTYAGLEVRITIAQEVSGIDVSDTDPQTWITLISAARPPTAVEATATPSIIEQAQLLNEKMGTWAYLVPENRLQLLRRNLSLLFIEPPGGAS